MIDKCLTYDPSLFEVRMKTKKFSTTLHQNVMKSINLSNFGLDTIAKVAYQKVQRSSMTGSKISNNLSKIVNKAFHKEKKNDSIQDKEKQSKDIYKYLFNTSELPSIQYKIKNDKKCKKYGKSKFINILDLDLKGKKINICKNLVKSQKLNNFLKGNTPKQLDQNTYTIGETSRNFKQKKGIYNYNNSTTNLATLKYENLYRIIKQLYKKKSKKPVKISLPRITPLDNCISNQKKVIIDKTFKRKNHLESVSLNQDNCKKIMTDLWKKNSNERMIRINVKMDNKSKYQSIYLARLKTLIERMN